MKICATVIELSWCFHMGIVFMVTAKTWVHYGIISPKSSVMFRRVSDVCIRQVRLDDEKRQNNNKKANKNNKLKISHFAWNI